jgi:hypothetical protein
MPRTLDIDLMLNYLRENRHLLDISGIAEDAGISRSVLANALDNRKDGRGYKITVPKKHWDNLYRTLIQLKIETP